VRLASVAARPGTGDLPALPVIGQGTWTMGERPERRTAEIDALRLGVELGMRLIDTAELYGAGRTERLVGEAIRDCRDDVFLVTKVWPSHAEPDAVLHAVEGSLRRLGTERVEVVLLHFPTNSVPIARTWQGFDAVLSRGLARYVGASNFSAADMAAADAAAPQGRRLTFHQARYGLDERRAEKAVIPEALAGGRIFMAYSPLAHGRLMRHPGFPVLRDLADRRGVSAERLALAWSVQRPGIVAIPKASSAAHVRDNALAGDDILEPAEIARLEGAFAPAAGPLPGWLPHFGAFFRLAMWGLRRRFPDA